MGCRSPPKLAVGLFIIKLIILSTAARFYAVFQVAEVRLRDMAEGDLAQWLDWLYRNHQRRHHRVPAAPGDTRAAWQSALPA